MSQVVPIIRNTSPTTHLDPKTRSLFPWHDEERCQKKDPRRPLLKATVQTKETGTQCKEAAERSKRYIHWLKIYHHGSIQDYENALL